MNIFCPKCKEKKDISLFCKDKYSKSGFKCHCKLCSSKAHHKWRINSKKHCANYMTKYRKDNLSRIRAIQRKCYRNNQDRVSRYRKSEKGILSSRACLRRRRKYMKNTSDGSIKTKFLLNLIKEQNYKCAICFKDIKLKVNIKHKKACDLDHIIPLSKGGTHTSKNVQFLCKKCNSFKRDKLNYTNN